MNSLSPQTHTPHTSQSVFLSVPPTPSTPNSTIKPNLLSQIMHHLLENTDNTMVQTGEEIKQPVFRNTLDLSLS